MTELLPCPFCGGDVVLDPHDAADGAYFVYCSNWNGGKPDHCQCDLGSFDNKSDAIAAWNHRALAKAKTTD